MKYKMKYYNEIKLEIMNTEENIKFAQKVAVDFVEPVQPTSDAIEEVKEMVREVIEAVKQKHSSVTRIILSAQLNDNDIVIEAKKKEIE